MLEEGRYQGTCTYQYTMNGTEYSEHSRLNNSNRNRKQGYIQDYTDTSTQREIHLGTVNIENLFRQSEDENYIRTHCNKNKENED